MKKLRFLAASGLAVSAVFTVALFWAAPSSATDSKHFTVTDTQLIACWGYDPGTIDANVRYEDGYSENFHPWPYTLTDGCYTFTVTPGHGAVAWAQVHDFDCHIGEDNSGREDNCSIQTTPPTSPSTASPQPEPTGTSQPTEQPEPSNTNTPTVTPSTPPSATPTTPPVVSSETPRPTFVPSGENSASSGSLGESSLEAFGPASSSTPSLANTGFNAFPLFLGGAVIVLLGALALVALKAERRR